MWPEGLIASIASDVRNHPVCCFSHFGQDLQDLQDWRRIDSRPFDAACSVCTQDTKAQRKRGNGALRIEGRFSTTKCTDSTKKGEELSQRRTSRRGEVYRFIRLTEFGKMDLEKYV